MCLVQIPQSIATKTICQAWTEKATPPRRLTTVSATKLGEMLYVLVHVPVYSDLSIRSPFVAYKINNDSWTSQKFPTGGVPRMTAYKNNIYVLPGTDKLPTCEKYSKETNKWNQEPVFKKICTSFTNVIAVYGIRLLVCTSYK